MALFGETRQGFVVTVFGVVIFRRLVVVGAAGDGLLFGLLPPGRERRPTWTYPHHQAEGEWLVGWHLEWCCCFYATSYPPPASRDRCSAETSAPPGGGRGVWLPTLQGWALPTPDSIPME